MSLEVIQLAAENEKLRADNDALRHALAERNAKYWTLCDEVERLFKTIEGEKRESETGLFDTLKDYSPELWDDAELDGTDGAHPAWWRGHEHSVRVMCEMINAILDGKDNGHGVSPEPWESTRRRMLNLAIMFRGDEVERLFKTATAGESDRLAKGGGRTTIEESHVLLIAEMRCLLVELKAIQAGIEPDESLDGRIVRAARAIVEAEAVQKKVIAAPSESA